jgi:hypothetical protein
MENLSAIAITSLSNYLNTVNLHMPDQPGVKDKASFNISNSIPSKEKIDYLNKIGQEYPFCVSHKHRNNDPL